jgi:hypothetical protein
VIWDHRCTAFVFGCIGGFGVNVFRWYWASINPKDKPEFDLLYWAQFFGMALLGGFWSLANDLVREINPLVALNIGVTIPALAKAAAEEKIKNRRRRMS